MVSEELENVVEVERERSGDYVVFFDPLDGSNNIDCLSTIGTIFAFYKRWLIMVPVYLIFFVILYKQNPIIKTLFYPEELTR